MLLRLSNFHLSYFRVDFLELLIVAAGFLELVYLLALPRVPLGPVVLFLV